MSQIILIFNSIWLDYKFLKTKHLSWKMKVDTVRAKYELIMGYIFNQFTEKITFHKHSYYFISRKYSIAAYQLFCTIQGSFLKDTFDEQNMIIIDVGSSIGNSVLYFKHRFPQSTLHCFEPLKDSFEKLTLNTKNYSNINVYNMAISSKTTELYLDVNGEKSKITQNTKSNIQATSLDSFYSKNNIKHINILKIDAESHELEIIVGAQDVLKYTQYLLIEITILNNTNYTVPQLIKNLISDEFNFQLVNSYSWYDNSTQKLEMLDCLFENIYYNSKK